MIKKLIKCALCAALLGIFDIGASVYNAGKYFLRVGYYGSGEKREFAWIKVFEDSKKALEICSPEVVQGRSMRDYGLFISDEEHSGLIKSIDDTKGLIEHSQNSFLESLNNPNSTAYANCFSSYYVQRLTSSMGSLVRNLGFSIDEEQVERLYIGFNLGPTSRSKTDSLISVAQVHSQDRDSDGIHKDRINEINMNFDSEESDISLEFGDKIIDTNNKSNIGSLCKDSEISIEEGDQVNKSEASRMRSLDSTLGFKVNQNDGISLGFDSDSK